MHDQIFVSRWAPATPCSSASKAERLRRAGFPLALLVQLTRFEAFHLANLGSLVHRRFAASGRMQEFLISRSLHLCPSNRSKGPLLLGRRIMQPPFHLLNKSSHLPRSFPTTLPSSRRRATEECPKLPTTYQLPTDPLLLIVRSKRHIPLLPPHPSRSFKHPLGPTLPLASVDQPNAPIHLDAVLGLPIPPADRIAHHGERPDGEGHRLAHEPGFEVREGGAVVRWWAGAGRGSGRGAEEGAVDEDVKGVP
jgi:hypothetical protein